MAVILNKENDESLQKTMRSSLFNGAAVYGRVTATERERAK